MNKKELLRQKIAGYFTSLLVFTLVGGFILSVVQDALLRTFANGLWHEMYGMELLVDPKTREFQEIREYDMDEALDYARSEAFGDVARRRYDEDFLYFFLVPGLLLITLLLARGWSNVKSRVKAISPQVVFPEGILPLAGMKRVKWYLGRATFSYGFFQRRMVLGTDYLMAASWEKKDFLLHHEWAHLQFRDSVVKNFLINTGKFFLPVFYVVLFFTALLSSMAGLVLSEGTNLATMDEPPPVFIALFLGFMVMAVLYILLFRAGFRHFQRWFAHSKEFVADRIAALRTGVQPDLSGFSADPYHPAGPLRQAYARGEKRKLSLYPFFFFAIVLANLNFVGTSSFYPFFFALAVGLPLLLLAADLFYFRMMSVSGRQLLLLTGLLAFFVAWNAFVIRASVLAGVDSMAFFETFLLNGLLNAALLLMLLLFFFGVGIAKRLDKTS